MLTIFTTLLAIVFAGQAQAQIIVNSESYGYPDIDAFTSTLVTVSVATPKEAKWTQITMYPLKRKINGEKAYIKVRLYSPQTMCDKSELVFLFTGIGSGASSGTSNYYANEITKTCKHVLILPSIFHKHFIRGVSRTGVVGDSSTDMEDYYSFMVYAKKYLSQYNNLDFETYSMTGFSLGALTAAFLAELDTNLQIFNFRKVVLINTPYDLAYGMETIDAFTEKIDKWSTIRILKELFELGREFLSFRGSEPTPVRYRALSRRTDDLSMEEKKALIGFGLSNSITSTVLHGQDTLLSIRGINQGIIPKFPRRHFSRNVNYRTSRLKARERIASQFNFKKYIGEILIPYQIGYEGDSDLTFKIHNKRNSLSYIAGFLAQSKNIFLMHNADDFLLRDGDIPILFEIFKDRMILYPRGGHLGNFWFEKNIQDLLSFLD